MMSPEERGARGLPGPAVLLVPLLGGLCLVAVAVVGYVLLVVAIP